MRRLMLLALIGMASLASAASAPLAATESSLEQQLRTAQADLARSEAEERKLEAAAGRARGEAARLQAESAAAAQAIDAAESRISAAEAELRLDSARVAAFERELEKQQQPLSALLAGLATMGERPPILALADRGGVGELVRMRILIDSTMPIIRRRSDAIAARIAMSQRLQRKAAEARSALISSREDLIDRRRRFAALEAKANGAALAAESEALSAGDLAIAGRETIGQLKADESRGASRAALAADLGAQPPIPLPAPPTAAPSVPFAYALPAAAPVSVGLAEVDRSGVRSRGIRMNTARGGPIVAPASGTIRFAGPFRDYDGVVIIDHGRGWLSLLLNVTTTLKSGTKVEIGQDLGRALGPIEVELSRNGQFVSPAIIAGSSRNLSKTPKSG